MSWNTIRPRKTDTLFSKYIRRKRTKSALGMNCEYCGRWKELGLLDVSHFWSRRHENTRYDESNVDIFCKAPCHRTLEHEKGEGRDYWNWKLEKLGKAEFDRLMLRAHQTAKRDDRLILAWLKLQDGYPWR